MKKFHKLAALICIFSISLTSFPPFEFISSAETDTTQVAESENEVNADENTGLMEDEDIRYMFTLPDNMRASVITPSVEFFTDSNADVATVSSELE